jgi:hypothetical protein
MEKCPEKNWTSNGHFGVCPVSVLGIFIDDVEISVQKLKKLDTKLDALFSCVYWVLGTKTVQMSRNISQ